jgi:DNA (cytosine-5)-methyltransferase 1
MKVLDLFSGIGGFSLGLEWAGMSTVAMCEKDPYCRKILAKHWPDLTIHEDIRNLDGKEYRNSIDLVAGGFPCQPFSVAGKRKGTDDDRHLWPEMLRVIKEAKPRWVIGENVFGFINMALDDVQADLEREHYEVRKFVLPAVAVDAKHRRDRIFLVAYSNSPAVWNLPERQAQGRDNLQAGRQAITPHDGPSQSMANSYSEGLEIGQDLRENHEQELSPSERSGSERREDVANSHGTRGEAGLSGQESWQEGNSGELDHQGHQQSWREEVREWPAEPCVGRVADGVPNRVDRIKGLGNAVVPQLIQAIGELVIEADKEMCSGR